MSDEKQMSYVDAEEYITELLCAALEVTREELKSNSFSGEFLIEMLARTKLRAVNKDADVAPELPGLPVPPGDEPTGR